LPVIRRADGAARAAGAYPLSPLAGRLAAPYYLPDDRPFAREEQAMTIAVGDKIPSVTLKHLTESGMQEITTDEIFGGRTVVLFSVPGAFTPTCSAKHLPGFVEQADAFKEKGVDTIVCLAVNDPFVMQAWGKANNAGDKLLMLPDGNGTLTKAMGLEMDGTAYGLGHRGQRFALIARDGVVNQLNVEKPGAFEVSSADHVLKQL